jgi:hypothetical protein
MRLSCAGTSRARFLSALAARSSAPADDDPKLLRAVGRAGAERDGAEALDIGEDPGG